MRISPILICLLAAAPALAREVVLQNDKFTGSGQLTIPGKFAAGEAVAESFMLPPGARILGARLLVADGEAQITLRFYEEKGTAEPGRPLGHVTLQVKGDRTFHGVRFPEALDAVGPVRVAAFTDRATTAGGFSFLIDKSAPPERHSTAYINQGRGLGWVYNTDVPIAGTWVLHLLIDVPEGGPAKDMAPPAAKPDAGSAGTGGPAGEAPTAEASGCSAAGRGTPGWAAALLCLIPLAGLRRTARARVRARRR
jgi:hypothetical protein